MVNETSRVPDLIQNIGARLFPLPAGSKAPYQGTGRHAHKEAVPAHELTLKETENYGISLDRTFLVVDFDREDTDGWKNRLPATLRTRTRRGEHWLYVVPNGYLGQNRKFSAGDVKCNGYIVGPGSCVEGNVYLLVDPRRPAEAPAWLLDYCLNSRDDLLEKPGGSGEEYSAIPDGARDNALASIAGSMRKHGLNEQSIRSHLYSLVERGIVEQPEGREVTYQDVKRIARSIATKAPEMALGGLRLGRITFGNETDLVTPPIKWWVRGFVPKGELVMMYGKGGIGKSSFASWIACEVTKKGGKFLGAFVEEPFNRFLWRAYLGGVDRSLVAALEGAVNFKLPRDVEMLRGIIENSGIDLVYLDAIYSHFESVKGQNAAETARATLGPLAALAQETGCTILATFHENKAGDFLGTTEMVNVARCVLSAKRKGNGPLVIAAAKTNLMDPGYYMTMNGIKKDMVDRETGEVQLEEVEDGSFEPMQIVVAERGPNRLPPEVGEIDVDEIEEPPEKGKKKGDWNKL